MVSVRTGCDGAGSDFALAFDLASSARSVPVNCRCGIEAMTTIKPMRGISHDVAKFRIIVCLIARRCLLHSIAAERRLERGLSSLRSRNEARDARLPVSKGLRIKDQIMPIIAEGRQQMVLDRGPARAKRLRHAS